MPNPKNTDVEYKKTEEAKSQIKTASEYLAHRETENALLSAVLDYYAQVKDRCIAKPKHVQLARPGESRDSTSWMVS